MQEAAHELIAEQCQRIAIPKRFTMPIREIWDMQERLPRRSGKRADLLLDNPRFRAGYDFLLLRESAGEETDGLGEWWTEYQDANECRSSRHDPRSGQQIRNNWPRPAQASPQRWRQAQTRWRRRVGMMSGQVNMERVFIGMGSNLADPAEQLRDALKALAQLPQTACRAFLPFI
jgi:poly(A) polymerase